MYSIHDHPPGARCRTIAKNCTHESLRGREVRRPRAVGTAPPSALTCPPVIAGHDASRTMATGTSADEFTPNAASTKYVETYASEGLGPPRACAFQIVADDRNR